MHNITLLFSILKRIWWKTWLNRWQGDTILKDDIRLRIWWMKRGGAWLHRMRSQNSMYFVPDSVSFRFSMVFIIKSFGGGLQMEYSVSKQSIPSSSSGLLSSTNLNRSGNPLRPVGRTFSDSCLEGIKQYYLDLMSICTMAQVWIWIIWMKRNSIIFRSHQWQSPSIRNWICPRANWA